MSELETSLIRGLRILSAHTWEVGMGVDKREDIRDIFEGHATERRNSSWGRGRLIVWGSIEMDGFWRDFPVPE